MAIPAPGQVSVNASGLYGFRTGGIDQFAWCSISTGSDVETAHYLYARVDPGPGGDNVVSNVPFAGGRVYNVTPGPFTVNLACTASTSLNVVGFIPTLQTAQLTALFVPN